MTFHFSEREFEALSHLAWMPNRWRWLPHDGTGTGQHVLFGPEPKMLNPYERERVDSLLGAGWLSRESVTITLYKDQQ